MKSKTFEKIISTTGNSPCVVIPYNVMKKLNLKKTEKGEKGDLVRIKITKFPQREGKAEIKKIERPQKYDKINLEITKQK